MGVVGLDPRAYMYMCPADLSLVAEGYERRRRDEWERHILIVNSTPYLKRPVSYDDLFVGAPRAEKKKVSSKADLEEIKKQFKSLREAKDGV